MKLYQVVIVWLFLLLTQQAYAQGINLDFRTGVASLGDPPGLKTYYKKRLLAVEEVSARYEFCFTENCVVSLGPYVKASLFIDPVDDMNLRIAGGISTRVMIWGPMFVGLDVGLGESLHHFVAKSVKQHSERIYTQTRTAYDLTLNLGYEIKDKKLSIIAGITHISNGEPHNMKFFSKGQDTPDLNRPICSDIGLNQAWLGIRFRF